MSVRGRSPSPRAAQDGDVEMENASPKNPDKSEAKVIIVTNLTRNVVEAHLNIIFGFYGQITKIDLPLYGKSGQNRGKAALEFADSPSAHKAASHMDGGQLDGSILKVELSELPIRSSSRSRPLPPPPRNGRDRRRSSSRSRSRSPFARAPAFRSRNAYEPPPRRGGARPFARRGLPPPRDSYRPRSRTRSRSPIRRAPERMGRRRSPSYERGGIAYNRTRRSRSRSYSVRSSRSRSPSFSPSRSRSRSMSYSSYSRYSRSRSRSRSPSRIRRSRSRDDIRDSRSRSPKA